ncbi:MAG: DUF4298 domain-containing protein [Bacteroidales bacterium]|nr:DUF4298 domain-containing protein [Bacteroidales bacterium]
MIRKATADEATISRIAEMEAAYDKVRETVERLKEDLEALENLKDEIKSLEEYQSSGMWLRDFEADEAGRIPADLKRGVLSEDGLHNLLGDTDALLEALRKYSDE